MKVYFIGAGPGDPELITIKGARIIEQAQVIIYAGSLVNPAVLQYAQEGAEIHNSATMTLEDVIKVTVEAVKAGKTVARVHTGDPSIYGAIQEQMDTLDQCEVNYEVIPGVSSFVATAAALKQEYTLPGVTQTVILTRMEGRTPVPEKESIASLAKHKATMCIFLSVGMIDSLVKELMQGYPADTPVMVVQKASWPEQVIVQGTLEDIAQRVIKAGIGKTAMIVVGDIFRGEYEKSKLYDVGFTHEYRVGR
ncbi:MAG: precorrin-4 C(11)-methyltransferase [Thermincolia bacterium]